MNEPTRSKKKWWQVENGLAEQQPSMKPPAKQGQPCPKCYLADLDYDSLFRLSCPNCGYVAECGAFT